MVCLLEDRMSDEPNDYREFPNENGGNLLGISHPCPNCFTMLNVRGHTSILGPDKYYYCPECGSNYDAIDLIRCYNTKEM